MIYTSYYAMLRRLPNHIVPISISRGIPSWYQGESYNKLAPLWDTVKKYKDGGSWEDYTSEYYATVLNNLKQSDVYKDLTAISDGRDIALLCYEKFTDDCHRHIVAEWLRSAGIECIEYRF